MATSLEASMKRTIRRHQLREMVPLADSTIYEMEQRGEFPRRFALSPRCVVWDLSEVEACSPRADPLRSPVRSIPTLRNGDRARFESRVGLKQRHRRGDEYRDALLARDPGVDDIRPLLHHMAALNFVLCLVVDSA